MQKCWKLEFNAINTCNTALEKIILDYWYWHLLELFSKVKCTQLDSKDQARSPWLKTTMKSIENHNAHCKINGANTKHKKHHNVDQWKAWCECFEQRGHCHKNMWTLHRQGAHCQCVALSLPAHYICLSLKSLNRIVTKMCNASKVLYFWNSNTFPIYTEFNLK